MADENDVLGVQLEMGGFTSANLTILNDFIAAFEHLAKATNASFAPASGGGLATFNQSLKDTNAQLELLNTNLANVKNGTAAVTNSTTGTANAVKKLTAEQAEAKVEIQEHNKATMDFARNNSQVYKDRIEQDKNVRQQTKITNQTLTVSMADQKVLTREMNALEIKAAEERSELYQKRIAQEKAETDAIRQKNQEAKDAAANDKKRAADIKVASDNLSMLKLRVNELAQAYANSVRDTGKTSTQSQELLKNYNAANKELNQMNVALGRATSNSQLFGGSLATGFSYIRQMAYILPGIGIAGIFNLAFEAVGALINSLGIFNAAMDVALDKSIKFAGFQQQILDLNEEYNKSLRDTANWIERQKEINQVAHESNITILKDQIAITEANDKIAETLWSNEAASKAQQNDENYWKSKVALAEEIGRQMDDVSNKFSVDEKVQRYFGDLLNQDNAPKYDKKKLDALAAEYNYAKKLYELDNANYKQWIKSKQNMADASMALDVQRAENRRKYILDTANKEADLEKAKQEKIYDSIYSGERQKLDAISAMREQDIKKQRALITNIRDTPASYDKYTKEMLPGAKGAIEAAEAQISKIRIDAEEKSIKLREQYRQKRLDSIKALAKDEIEVEAIANEKIYKNIQLNLEDRLNAYDDYIDRKQELQDIERDRQLKATELLPVDDATKQLKVKEILSNAATQKANIQADVEHQTYTIVKQSYDKQLAELKLFLNEEDRTQLLYYTEELTKLNDQYAKKVISYKKYRDEIEKTIKGYDVKVLEDRLKDEMHDLEYYVNFKKDKDKELTKSQSELTKAEGILVVARKTGNKEFIQQAEQDVAHYKGVVEASADDVIKAQKEVDEATKKGQDTSLAIELAKIQRAKEEKEKDDKRRKEIYEAIKQMEQAIYNATKEIVDKRYEMRAKRIEEENALIQKNLSVQLDAVQKSSLAQKEQHALEAQLTAEKAERDRQAAAEVKRIKHDQAVFDKKITMMHIVFATAIAVAELIEQPWLAVAAGVAGAAQLATVAATEIPSYATGTPGHRGGLARFGEKGVELVNEPYRSPYLVYQDTIGYLPKGTEVIPISDSPTFQEKTSTGWEQTKWLAKQLKPQREKSKTVNIINIDLDFENHKRKILGN